MPRTQIFIGAVIGSVVTVFVGILIIIALNRTSTDPLSQAQFDDAWKRWNSAEISSYQMELKLGGTQPGNVELEVKEGVVVGLMRDGYEPDRRTWDIWSVEGLFDMIESDCANRETPREAFGVDDPGEVSITAEFDPETGVPIRYRRFVLGHDNEVDWEVTRFERLDQ